VGSISYAIPVAGQPNATEYVKVATALQTLLTAFNGSIDAIIEVVCARLSGIPVPPVSPDEVRRAWVRQRDAFPGPPPGFFDESGPGDA
jgi:hypothetical protein